MALVAPTLAIKQSRLHRDCRALALQFIAEENWHCERDFGQFSLICLNLIFS
jgi:hypothetical protein